MYFMYSHISFYNLSLIVYTLKDNKIIYRQTGPDDVSLRFSCLAAEDVKIFM